jgi:immune inhibitor A
MQKKSLIILGVSGAMVVCFICAVVFVAVGILVWRVQPTQVAVLPSQVPLKPSRTPVPTIVVTTPKPKIPTATTNNRLEEQPTLEIQVNVWPVPTDTLQTLEQAVVPVNDLLDLARRFKGLSDIPVTVSPPTSEYTVGNQQEFWASNVDTNENFRVKATLQYVTDHVYFWIEDGVSFDRGDLKDLVETFENDIYPTDREFFGSEWTPGVDGDIHLYILYAQGLGYNLAGYFSSADEFHPDAHKYSNAHEMFLLNADNIGLSENFTYGVLAHEFQHMIHWYRDRNESSWLNEGFSEVAALLNGYYGSGFDYLYAQDPDLQLNDWPNDPNQTIPHYGASFLYLTYFLDRFGEDATKALVADPANGMSSVDDVLEAVGARDPLTGKTVTADDVFSDWAVTMYLQDSSIPDGRYTYTSYDSVPSVSDTEVVRTCPTGIESRDVHQYGVDYINFTCRGDYVLHFTANTQVGLLPESAYSGEYAFWSNKSDESDMILTQQFDFSAHSGPLTLKYWTWYDLEEDFDYLYLTASVDGSQWEILTTPSGTDIDPSGNSYGWGYNAFSGGGNSARWIQESVDLSRFAGQKVYLRFEYVTDEAVNGEGFLLDDVEIPEIGYFTDFESNDGGWDSEGWVRIRNELPQIFSLSLITQGKSTIVTPVTLGPANTVDIPFSIQGDIRHVVLVVSGTTRFTRQLAEYQFEVLPSK